MKLKLNRLLQLFFFRIAPPAILTLMIPPLRTPAWLGVLGMISLWTLGEAWVEDSRTNREAVSSRLDRNTRHYILAAHFVSCWMPAAEFLVMRRIPLFPPLPEGSPLHGALLASGMLFLLMGALLRIVAVKTLGSFFTGHLQISPRQEVCRRGIYKYIRHPGYTALFFLNLGPSLAMGTPLTFIFSLLLTLWSNGRRVTLEEEALVREFGESYRSYSRETPRWLPIPSITK